MTLVLVHLPGHTARLKSWVIITQVSFIRMECRRMEITNEIDFTKEWDIFGHQAIDIVTYLLLIPAEK